MEFDFTRESLRSARPSPAAAIGVGLLVATWTALTFAHVERLVSTGSVAASPEQIAEGRVWLLVTSGLLVQQPIVVSLVSFVALAVFVFVICGVRVLWLSALVGHVLSTVIAYALLAAVRSTDHDVFQGLLSAPDYGVSAIAAAWLGAIAYTMWGRRGSSLRGRAAIVLSCVAVALFAWMMQRHAQRHLTFLDSEHAFAFVLGILVVRNRWPSRATLGQHAPVPARAER